MNFLKSGSAAALLIVCGVALGTAVTNLVSPVAFARQPETAPAPARTATVDVFGIVEKMIQSDRYMPAREAHNKEQREKLDKLVAELQSLQEKLQGLEPGKAETQTLAQEFDTKRQAFQQAQYDAQASVDKFNTVQLLEVYRLVLDATDKVALEKGYTHVISSRPARAENKSETISAALQEILARPILRAPVSDDLTPQISKELGV
jgi:Skp family chaperone for outer membrane proteins